jgi:signal transduction histidine kinase
MRPPVIFYLLVIYVFMQFCWWAYLLSDLEATVVLQKIENASLLRNAGIPAEDPDLLMRKLNARRWMILGEGSVFLLLLVLGAIKTKKAFEREVDLARQQKNFLLSVTHEFKSPLASIRLYLQTLQKRDLSNEQKTEFIRNAIGDTDRLNTLVENALLATQIEKKSYVFHQEPTDVSLLLGEVIDRMRGSPGCRVPIDAAIEPAVSIMTDRLGFTSMVMNIIENAEKYSEEGGLVSISLAKSAEHMILRVADQGPGIPDADKKRIFEKFYRVGNEETRRYKGTGLGLFIAAYFVAAFHGSISVADNKPKGSVFEVLLPLYLPPQS